VAAGQQILHGVNEPLSEIGSALRDPADAWPGELGEHRLGRRGRERDPRRGAGHRGHLREPVLEEGPVQEDALGLAERSREARLHLAERGLLRHDRDGHGGRRCSHAAILGGYPRSASCNTTLKVWDLATGACLETWTGTREAIGRLARRVIVIERRTGLPCQRRRGR
jgi:hypothetical protein